jgi:hypothetical protein
MKPSTNSFISKLPADHTENCKTITYTAFVVRALMATDCSAEFCTIHRNGGDPSTESRGARLQLTYDSRRTPSRFSCRSSVSGRVGQDTLMPPNLLRHHPADGRHAIDTPGTTGCCCEAADHTYPKAPIGLAGLR